MQNVPFLSAFAYRYACPPSQADRVQSAAGGQFPDKYNACEGLAAKHPHTQLDAIILV